MGMGFLHPLFIQLKIYAYLPTIVKKRLQDMKPCCFSFDWQHKLEHAVQNNHLECLKKAYKNGCEWNSDICNMLMLLNHKTCLLYAHENKCDWDWCTCDSGSGNFYECVENGLNLIKNHTGTSVVCDKLVVLNNERCLSLAHSNGYDWDWCTCDEVGGDIETCVKNGLNLINKYSETDLCDRLSVENNGKCLLFAHTNGHDWEWCTCDEVEGDKKKCVTNGLYKIHILPTLVA
jgi:hypothetical protein